MNILDSDGEPIDEVAKKRFEKESSGLQEMVRLFACICDFYKVGSCVFAFTFEDKSSKLLTMGHPKNVLDNIDDVVTHRPVFIERFKKLEEEQKNKE